MTLVLNGKVVTLPAGEHLLALVGRDRPPAGAGTPFCVDFRMPAEEH